VILKPEHKNPVSRYGINRLTLTDLGIPNPTVDRAFRCLFVYSVSFYEMIKKLISHCNRKYTIIISIWKVFSVLLEYCCQSDYRMLISDITKQHEVEIKACRRASRPSAELERERTNERTLRLKLEEEYMQNSKNHEEEVQLRLKFEGKLNSMHSKHRELEIKHKRLQQDYEGQEQVVAKHEATIKA
jgi:hypothetical protein